MSKILFKRTAAAGAAFVALGFGGAIMPAVASAATTHPASVCETTCVGTEVQVVPACDTTCVEAPSVDVVEPWAASCCDVFGQVDYGDGGDYGYADYGHFGHHFGGFGHHFGGFGHHFGGFGHHFGGFGHHFGGFGNN